MSPRSRRARRALAGAAALAVVMTSGLMAAAPAQGDSGGLGALGAALGGLAQGVVGGLQQVGQSVLATPANLQPTSATSVPSPTSSPLGAVSPLLHQVPGVLAGLARATLLGTASPNQVLNVGVSAQRPDSAGELALYNELYNPKSALYHHFLSAPQFAQRFGLSAASRGAIEQWLRTDGATVTAASPLGDYYTVSGTVAQLDRLFSVSIGDYALGKSRFVANNVAPSVPESLPITNVVGLDTVGKFVSLLSKNAGHKAGTKVGAKTAAKPAKSATHAKKAVGLGQGVQTTLTPQDLWGVYNDPASASGSPLNTAVDYGQGQTMGIFGEGESSSVVDDLRLFEQAENLPKVPVRVVETEGQPESDYGDNSGSLEFNLDTQASTGMAPDVSRLDLYFSKSLSDADVFASFDDWANDPNGPRQMNASFGECEENPTNPITAPLATLPYGTELGNNLEAVGDPILRQAAMEGRTLFAATGDTAAGCPEVVLPVLGAGNGLVPQPIPLVDYPAASPYAVAVGGTVVSVAGSSGAPAAQRAGEVAWTFTGGGTSHFIPEPGFQSSVAAVDQPCLATPDGLPYVVGAPVCRGIPDVSDMSGNVTGNNYFIVVNGAPSSEGGTSLSSPLMMGQWTRVQAAASRATQGAGGLGFADETIYRQAQGPDYGRDFFDVTDSEYGVGNVVYQPGPGWDYASGWGSLNVANFISDVDGTTNAAFPKAPAEAAAFVVSQAQMSSPFGNAIDPNLSLLGDDTSLDLTGATLSASAANGVVATLSGPAIGNLPPPDATGGSSFVVQWEYQGTEYFAQANESPLATWSFTSGSTTSGADPNTNATGTVANGTITIDIPASEVGSPKAGALLAYPEAYDLLNLIGVGTPVISLGLSPIADSADNLVPVQGDMGASESRGVAVRVGS
jgi:pseudomonalisin